MLTTIILISGIILSILLLIIISILCLKKDQYPEVSRTVFQPIDIIVSRNIERNASSISIDNLIN